MGQGNGYLLDTCLTAQDEFKTLDYFQSRTVISRKFNPLSRLVLRCNETGDRNSRHSVGSTAVLPDIKSVGVADERTYAHRVITAAPLGQ